MAAQDGYADVNCAAQLGTKSRKDYSFDFVNELSDIDGNLIDAIATVDWTITPTGPTLTGQFILDTVAGVFVENPKAAQAYRLHALMESTGGRKAEASWALGGIQVDPT